MYFTEPNARLTIMDSSRMHAVCCSGCWGRGCLPLRGVYKGGNVCPVGCLIGGCVCPGDLYPSIHWAGGCLPRCMLGYRPPVDRILDMLLTVNILTAEHLENFHIDASNNSDGSSARQCAHEPGRLNPSETRVYTCPCGIYGRYVRIRYSRDRRSHMQLCEVQVQAGGAYHQEKYNY